MEGSVIKILELIRYMVKVCIYVSLKNSNIIVLKLHLVSPVRAYPEFN